MKRFFVAASMLVTSIAYGFEPGSLASGANLEHFIVAAKVERTIVSVKDTGQLRTVVRKDDYKEYVMYVKWELNCSDSTARYLGTSNSADKFDAAMQERDFKRASDNVTASMIFEEACKVASNPLTASQ